MQQQTTILKEKMDACLKTFLSLMQRFEYYADGMERIHKAYPQLIEVGAITQMESDFKTAFENHVRAFEDLYDDLIEKEKLLSLHQGVVDSSCDADKDTRSFWRMWAEAVAGKNGTQIAELSIPPLHIANIKCQAAIENILDLKKPMSTIMYERGIMKEYGFDPMSETRINEAQDKLVEEADKLLKKMEEFNTTFLQIFKDMEDGGVGKS